MRSCENCGNKMVPYLKCATMGKCDINLSDWMSIKETISFPILNNLKPTIESSTFKVLEEIGEVFMMLGKGQALSGEGKHAIKQIEDTEFNILLASEVIDMAQASVTLAHEICKHYGIIMDDIMTAHEEKLRQRGYLK